MLISIHSFFLLFLTLASKKINKIGCTSDTCNTMSVWGVKVALKRQAWEIRADSILNFEKEKILSLKVAFF